MEKPKLRVIKGNKIQGIEKKYNFIEAQVTNTRLMGVIGLRITWELDTGEIYHQFFHLDAEEYGFDDYAGITNGSDEEIENITGKTMGGLGGELISLSEREARYLIKAFASKNKQWRQPMPEPEWEYFFILKEEVSMTDKEIEKLWDKVCDAIHSPNQLINYYIMRAVGLDTDGMAYLSSQDIDYKPVNRPATLLKNTIEAVQEEGSTSYITESVVDMGEHYKMVVSELHIVQTPKGPRIDRAEIRSAMNITSTEAAFSLGKKEYLLIYQINDILEILRLLDLRKPHAMRHVYEAGYLFTEFNPTNEHVNKNVYYLNEDIYGVYYVTAGEQLVAAAYSKERIEEIKEYFGGGLFHGLIDLEEELDLDNLLLYEFVHSEYDNIYDFLDED